MVPVCNELGWRMLTLGGGEDEEHEPEAGESSQCIGVRGEEVGTIGEYGEEKAWGDAMPEE